MNAYEARDGRICQRGPGRVYPWRMAGAILALVVLLSATGTAQAAATVSEAVGLSFTFTVVSPKQPQPGGREPKPVQQSGAQPGSQVPLARAFSDLNGHWAAGEVAALAEVVELGSDINGRFHPDKPVTRGEFVTWLGWVLALARDGPPGPPALLFADVPPDAAYAPYLAQLGELGLVNGVGAGSFAPERPLTRLELMVLAGRLARAAGIEATEGVLAVYKDSAQVPSWAQSDLAVAVAAGIIRGRPEALLAPNLPATRAEAAATLSRVRCKLVNLGGTQGRH